MPLYDAEYLRNGTMCTKLQWNTNTYALLEGVISHDLE